MPTAPTVPIPRSPVTVRVATLADLPFMDALQRANTRAVGYFPTRQFQDYLAAGQVVIGEEVRGQKSEVSADPTSNLCPLASSSLTSDLRPLTSASPLG